MSEYQPALDQLRERRKGKSGDLSLVIGLASMAIAPFVLAIVQTESSDYEALKAHGVVSEAQIVDHERRENARADRKGRERSTTSHLLKVSYDLNSATSYADWKAGGTIAKGQYPVIATSEFEVPESYLETNPVGATKPVVMMRGDSSSLELVEQMEYETSVGYFLKYYAAMAVLFAAGLAMAIFGWRKRKVHG